MVSIIIPAYNCESYIGRCLDSVLTQDVALVEVLVVNDGSKDNTPKILDEISQQDSRVKVFHVENGGPSKARNIGIDNARGEWLLFVDADDWVDKDILSHLELNTDTSADIIFFGLKRCYDNGVVEICMPQSYQLTSDLDKVYNQLNNLLISREEFFGYSVNKVYKNSIVKEHKIRFCEGLHVREDELFALNYCRYVKSIQTLQLAPYNYRIMECSLSHNSCIPYRNYLHLVREERKVIESLQKSSFQTSLQRRIFTFYIDSIIECVRLNRIETKVAIEEALSFYDEHRTIIEIPIWMNFIFGFSLKKIRRNLVYFAFFIRGKLKKM